jgi:hypothetical protein
VWVPARARRIDVTAEAEISIRASPKAAREMSIREHVTNIA